MHIEQSSFGTTRDGQAADLFTCSNDRGTVLKMTNYGATMTALEVAGRNGNRGNVMLGFQSVEDYEAHDAYFGATIGRYGNRIARGRFRLEGNDYSLAQNNGKAHLHGGLEGFDKVIWTVESVLGEGHVGLRFNHSSPDGDEGYPGTLDVSVVYTLNNEDEVHIEYSASTDASTIINLTNHSYWNLSAGATSTILNHRLQINADQYLAIDSDMIPTVVRDVAGGDMDFTAPRAIGERISGLKHDAGDPHGYDHNFILRNVNSGLIRAAFVLDPASGRTMEVLTTEPGLQFYSGNFLDGSARNGGHPQHAAFCLETQHFPDSPNRPDFPSVVLKPGEQYHSLTLYRFGLVAEV